VATGSRVEIHGLREFQRELRKADASLLNDFRKVHRKVSDLVGDRARAAMHAGGPQGAKAAKGVKSRATSKSAFLDTVPKPPYALATIWGQKRRSGWYRAPRYAASTGRQFQSWVGNQWDPGEHGGEPYYIGPAIDASLDEVERIYMDGIEDLTRRAFPD
jgi:hypothetical protein